MPHTLLPAYLAELPPELAFCAWSGSPRWGMDGEDIELPTGEWVYVCSAYCRWRLNGADHDTARALAWWPGPLDHLATLGWVLLIAVLRLVSPRRAVAVVAWRQAHPKRLRRWPAYGEHGRPDRAGTEHHAA